MYLLLKENKEGAREIQVATTDKSIAYGLLNNPRYSGDEFYVLDCTNSHDVRF
jgi:hypothetical protein